MRISYSVVLERLVRKIVVDIQSALCLDVFNVLLHLIGRQNEVVNRVVWISSFMGVQHQRELPEDCASSSVPLVELRIAANMLAIEVDDSSYAAQLLHC